MPYSGLAPASVNLCLSVAKKLLAFFPKPQGCLFLIGLSGGADSIALTVVFHLLAKCYGFHLHILHLDHSIRPESSRDADFVRNFCVRLGLECEIKKVDIPAIALQNRQGLEEAGRIARYALFREAAVKLNATAILLAHHAGDLAEDILLRLCRGAGWPALGGMKEKTGNIFRPLLFISPDELRLFLQNENITWIEDNSNNDLRFKRNRFRHQILPLLKRENPAFIKTAINLQKFAAIDDDFFDTLLNDDFCQKIAHWLIADGEKSIFIARDNLLDMHKALRIRFYIKILKKIIALYPEGYRPQVTAQKLLKLDDTFINNGINKIFQFGKGLIAIIKKTGIIFKVSRL